MTLNGKNHGKTKKRIKNLQPETEYAITISIIDENSNVNEWQSIIVKTEKKKKFLDITKAPYNCVFNSFTIYTDLPYNNDGESAPTLPKFEKISLKNVKLTGVKTFLDGKLEKLDCIEMYGLDEDEYHLKDISLYNITIVGKEDTHEFKIKNVKNLVLENINLLSQSINKLWHRKDYFNFLIGILCLL